MDAASWATVIAGTLTFLGTVAVQVMVRSGEPRKLKTLRLMTELIEKYETRDEGRDALLAARQKLAVSLASALSAPPQWERFAYGATISAIGGAAAAVVVILIQVLLTGGSSGAGSLSPQTPQSSEDVFDGRTLVVTLLTFGIPAVAGAVSLAMRPKKKSGR